MVVLEDMVAFMVEFMNGSVLFISLAQMSIVWNSRLETNQLSDKRVHAKDVLDVGSRNIVSQEVASASRAEVLGSRIQ
jgi:hypothetical protein